MSVNEKVIYIGPVYMPDGSSAPELMTEEEAIRFLRLDTDGPKRPEFTLRYYRDQQLLKGIRVGKRIRYPKKELLKFIDSLLDRN